MLSVSELLDLVAVQGPWLLFLMALLETSFVWGFFIPTGLALSFAAAVAFDEGGSIPMIAAAAIGGGAIGDTIGFWVGRKGREHWERGTGRITHFVIAARDRTEQWFGGRPLLSITIPRLISFVRTVMPLAAGMSGISYARFLGYELPGLLLWCAIYMAAGMAAGEGWSWAARILGPEGATLFVALAAAAAALIRRRRLNPPERSR